MRKFLYVTAVGWYCSSLPLLAEAGSFKWNANNKARGLDWAPAGETPAAGFHQPPLLDERQQSSPASADKHPEPTSPPDLRRMEERLLAAAKRSVTSEAPSICGYFDGQSGSAFFCGVTESCVFTEYGDDWVAGCCPTTSLDCPVQTTCVDGAVGSSIESTSTVGDYTYWCYGTDYPYCVTYTYGDMSGYTNFGCAATRVATAKLIDYNPLTTSTTTTSSTTSSSTTPAATGPEGADISNNKTSIPIGPIVGGIVGGIAVIALLVLGLVFLLRNKRRNKNDDDDNNNNNNNVRDHNSTPDPHTTYLSVVGGASGGDRASQGPPPPGGQDYQYHHIQPVQMQEQQQQYGQKPPYSVHTKSVYDPVTAASPPTSPPPPHQPQEQAPAYHEMPADTGDRELRELA